MIPGTEGGGGIPQSLAVPGRAAEFADSNGIVFISMRNPQTGGSSSGPHKKSTLRKLRVSLRFTQPSLYSLCGFCCSFFSRSSCCFFSSGVSGFAGGFCAGAGLAAVGGAAGFVGAGIAGFAAAGGEVRCSGRSAGAAVCGRAAGADGDGVRLGAG